VIKQGEEGRDKNDGGQDLEGEDGTLSWRHELAEVTTAGEAELAEDHLGAGEGAGEHLGDDIAGPGHEALSVIEAENEEGEGDLQAQAPGDGAPADAAAVSGTKPGGSNYRNDSKQSGETIQGETPPSEKRKSTT
jgi:hypothetical protein